MRLLFSVMLPLLAVATEYFVNPSGSKLVTCGAANDPCATLALALGNAVSGGDVVTITGTLFGPGNVNLLLTVGPLLFQGQGMPVLDGGGEVIFRTDPSLLFVQQPSFQDLTVANGAIEVGDCGTTVHHVDFVDATLRYSSTRVVPQEAKLLYLNEVSFTRSALQINTGVAMLAGVQFLSNGTGGDAALAGITLRGKVRLTGLGVAARGWPGVLLDADCTGLISLNQNTEFTNCPSPTLLQVRGGADLELTSCVFDSNAGGVIMRDGLLTMVGTNFSHGRVSADVDLSNGTAIVTACSFMARSAGLPCITCATKARVAVLNSVFYGNIVPVLASVATVQAGCTLEMDKKQASFASNSVPAIACDGGALAMDAGWSGDVQCTDSCTWGYCANERVGWSGYGVAMLVFGIVGLLAILGALGWWAWKTRAKGLLRRLEYQDIQGAGEIDDL
jgi:hypothetical protein